MSKKDDLLIDSLRWYTASALSTCSALINGRVERYMQTVLDVVGSDRLSDDRKLAIIAERIDDIQMEFAKCRVSLEEQKKRFENAPR